MDLNEIVQGSKEPEVVKAVFNELKRYGDDNKKIYEELRKNFESLKKEIDSKSNDPLVDEKVKKLGEDISIRQQKLDESIQKNNEALHKRIDDVEVAMQRPGLYTGTPDAKAMEDARKFAQSVDAAKGNGARIDTPDPDIKAYAEYQKNFERFLRGRGEKFMNDQERKAMMVGSDPDGGYLVPIAMSNMIITRLYELDPIRELAAVETISTSAIEWLVDYDQAYATWEEETVSVPANSDTADLGKKRIAVFPLAARPHVTQTLIEDASVNVEAWLSRKAADRFARVEGAAFVTGNGVGKPRGFLDYADYTTAGTDEYGRVEQIHMGNAAAITADGFILVKYSLPEQYLNRGTWLMNRSTVSATMRLKDGAGDYIWKPGLTSDANSTILGLPVRMSTTMPAISASSMSVALADWKEAYMIVDRIGITVLRDPYTVKPFVQFYFRKRVGGDVVNFQAIKIGTIEA